MDETRLDEWTKTLGRCATRRMAVGAAAAGGIAAVLKAAGLETASAKKNGSIATGISAGGDEMAGTISGSRVEDVFDGIIVGGDFTVEDNQLEETTRGIVVLGIAVVTGNTIEGAGAVSGPTQGVWFVGSASGSVGGNTISNVVDSDAGDVGCGILLDAGATGVTLGANTFPNPEGSVPGNEQNVCDNRP